MGWAENRMGGARVDASPGGRKNRASITEIAALIPPRAGPGPAYADGSLHPRANLPARSARSG